MSACLRQADSFPLRCGAKEWRRPKSALSHRQAPSSELCSASHHKILWKNSKSAASQLPSTRGLKNGKVINFFKVLAYKPEILKTFLEFYQEVWREGKLPAITKELAYLRTSILNGCAY